MTDSQPVPVGGTLGQPTLNVLDGAAGDQGIPPPWRDWLSLTRPRQWPKNLLVAAAALAAGRWTSTDTITDIVWAFALFTVTAAGCYMVNDVRDAQRDRWHPRKRRRPVAAGRVRPEYAATAGSICILVAPATAFLTGYPWLALSLMVYDIATVGYSLGLKRVPVLEIGVLAFGFVLRPLAGAAAAQIPPSGWFLGVTCAGAVMVATGKRSAELATPGVGERHRRSLRSYSPRGLRSTQMVAAVALAGTYVGWAVTRPSGELPFALLSLLAVCAAVSRFVVRSRRGDAGTPEELLLHDRWLLLSAAVWIAAMLVGSVRA